MAVNQKELLFVYNADTGIFSVATDFAHKILSPKTYPCKLCALTYGNFTMKQEWKAFLEKRGEKLTFLHKNEFTDAHPNQNHTLPAIFILNGDQPELLVSAEKINGIETLEEMIKVMEAALE